MLTQQSCVWACPHEDPLRAIVLLLWPSVGPEASDIPYDGSSVSLDIIVQMTDGPPSTQGREVGAEGLNAEDLGLIIQDGCGGHIYTVDYY